MTVAVIGSQNIGPIDLSEYIPPNATKIICRKTDGIGRTAAEYAKLHFIPFTAFQPEYMRYQKASLAICNQKIIDSCDLLVALWDGKSQSTRNAINYAKKCFKPCFVYQIKQSKRKQKEALVKREKRRYH